MSIYVMTVGELAKKRGEPVGEFLKKVQATGFEAGSHAKRLTQVDLDYLIALIDGTSATTEEPVKTAAKEKTLREVKNPNVLMIKHKDGTNLIAFVDATMEEDGTISIDIVESSVERTLGETLLEFRKQLGMKVGVN